MKLELLKILRCPKCRLELKLENPSYENDEIKEAKLICKNKCAFDIKNFIPRFVESDRYVDSFSFEWNKHRLTQFDSHNKNNASEINFLNFTGMNPKKLKNSLALDAGCGSGRYAEISSKYCKELVCIDLSYSIDFARENLKCIKNIHFVQADVFELPFEDKTFGFIYSLGVLHHTPDCKNAFKSLCRLLKKQGMISIFVYANYNKAIVYSSNFWRIFTTKLPKPILYYASFIAIPAYHIYKIPVIGHFLKTIFPISMEKDPMIRALDTFDWYSPKYQSKHTHNEVAQWFKEENLYVTAIPKGEVSMTGIKR